MRNILWPIVVLQSRIETPTDLHIQSSKWSNYKYHTTQQIFLIACAHNGAISYVSPLYSISDVE